MGEIGGGDRLEAGLGRRYPQEKVGGKVGWFILGFIFNKSLLALQVASCVHALKNAIEKTTLNFKQSKPCHGNYSMMVVCHDVK